MSIGAALSKSISGLQATQTGLSVISTNIASANMPGYVKRELHVSDGGGNGSAAAGVQSMFITRALDTASQALMRRAATHNGAAQTLNDRLQQLDAMMGGPGSAQGLDALYRQFSSALITTSNDRGNNGAMLSLVSAAGGLANEIGRLSRAVQAMRTDAESAIGSTVAQINDLAQQLANVNTELSTVSDQNDLLDQRDRIVDQLAELGDFNFTEVEHGRINVTTRGGIAIVGIGGAAHLDFDGHGSLRPNSLYSTDPALRGVGTIKVNGLDLLSGQHFTSGKLGALIALRDTHLAGSQVMLDDMAAGLALACRDPAANDGTSLFLDGVTPFTATATDDPQRIGLSQRLAVNRIYQTTPDRLEEMAAPGTDNVFKLISTRLTSYAFDVRSGVENAGAGSKTCQAFASQIVSDHAALIQSQSEQADSANVAKANFDKMFASRSGVDVNAQLADMVGLQNAYAANANVIKTLKELLDVLINI